MAIGISIVGLILGTAGFFLSVYVFVEFQVFKRSSSLGVTQDLSHSSKRMNYENLVRGQGNETPSLFDGLVPGEYEDNEIEDEDFAL
jgi:hypothetical protein